MAAYSIQQKSWHVNLSFDPEPSCVLVSAKELLQSAYYSENHNIFIYNTNVYTAGTFNSSSFPYFHQYYIDVEPAIFDKRSKPSIMKQDASSNLSKWIGADNGFNFYRYDKGAAQYPQNILDQFAVSRDWNNWMHPSSVLNDFDLVTGYVQSDFLTCGAYNEEGNSEAIIVSEEDVVFSSSMNFSAEKVAYNKMQLNLNNLKVLKLVIGAILFNSDESSLLNDITIINKANNAEDNLYTILYSLVYDSNKNILDYLYFWVKAPFCGDYVKVEDFNQELNQNSNVIHANLLLANNFTGTRTDFNRYDLAYTFDSTTTIDINDYYEKLTRSYCPLNSPIKDFLSKEILSLSGVLDSSSVTNTAQNLLSYTAADEDGIIGSVSVLPNTGTNEEYDSQNTRVTPFTYYDTESREGVSYYTSLGRIPTVLGKSGNIITDGRIMSPTIDELWYIIKKMLSGFNNTIDPIKANLVGSSYSGDTSLFETPQNRYKFEQDNVTWNADPIDFTFNFDNDNNIIGISAKEWIAEPESIAHRVYKTILIYSAKVNYYFNNQTVWNNEEVNSREVYSTSGSLLLDENGYFTMAQPDAEYGPRSAAPLSLRELEAFALGNKYNIDNNFIFSMRTYATTGKFGVELRDDEDNILQSGSLFQMHRDYNARIDDPNTQFVLFADNEKENGRTIDVDDLCGEDEAMPEGIIEDNIIYDITRKKKATDTKYKGKMPKLVSSYGNSNRLSREHGIFTGAEVYLGADGQWHYIHEHCRMPVLRSIY